MKTLTPLALASSVALALLVTASSLARACDACNAKQEIKLPDTTEGILKSLHEHHAVLRETVVAKKLNRVSFVVINMRTLAKALPAKAAGEAKATVEELVKDFSAILKDLGKAALREDQRETVWHLAKLEQRLKTLDGQFNYRTRRAASRRRRQAGN